MDKCKSIGILVFVAILFVAGHYLHIHWVQFLFYTFFDALSAFIVIIFIIVSDIQVALEDDYGI